MSMPAIFFVADRTTAEQVRLNHSLPKESVAEWGSVDTLKLSTLWTILTGGSEDPVELMDRFTEVRSSEEEWTHQIPEELVIRLATASPSELSGAAERWVQTEEMSGWSASDGLEVLTDVQRVARRAQQLQQPLFLYTSL